MAAFFTWLFGELVFAIMNTFGIEVSDGMVILLIIIFAFVYITTIDKSKTCRPVADALIVGLLWRIALLLFDIYGTDIYLLPNSGSDSVGFVRETIAYAQGHDDKQLFVITIGTLYKICGISRINGQFFIMLCSIVSLTYGAKMMQMLDVSIRNMRKSMWILCLLPNFAILSSIYLRESLVTMFVTLSMYKYVIWMKKKKELSFVWAIVFSFVAAAYHSGAIAIAVGILLSRLLYDNKSGKLSIKLKNIFACAIILIVSVFVLNRYGEPFLRKFQRVESIGDVANEHTYGGSAYAQYVGNSDTPLNMIIYTIPRIVFFLFSPMPWMIRGLSDIIAFLFSSCFYIWVTLSFFRYLFKQKGKDCSTAIVLYIVIMAAVFVFAWGTANTGTACRHRDKLTVLWAVLYAVTYTKKQTHTGKYLY